MKITYRTKYQATIAMKNGYEFLLIRRSNWAYYSLLEDIANAPVGTDSKTFEAACVSLYRSGEDITYRDMINM